MNIYAKCLAKLKFFHINEGDEFDLFPFAITGNEGVLDSELFNDPLFCERIGGIKLQARVEGFSFGFLKGDFTIHENSDVAQTLLMFARKYQMHISSYLAFLWFIKDNSVFLDELIIYSTTTHAIISGQSYYTTSTSAADSKPTTFSLNELERAKEICDKYYKEISHSTKNHQPNDLIPSKYGVAPNVLNRRPYNDKNRIERAMLFLDIARREEFLPFKIAFYVPIFESLFANDNTAVNFKVGERLARFLAGEKDERLTIFKLFNQAYDIRSRMLHGDILSVHKSKPERNTNLVETQLTISRQFDELTRRTLTKVILHESQHFLQDDMTEYYSSLLFSRE